MKTSVIALLGAALLAGLGIAAETENSGVRIVVSKEGPGDFRTVQEAVDAVPENGQSVTTIFVREGEYDGIIRIPRGKNRIHLVGENRHRTVLAGLNNDRLHPGTAERAVLRVEADDFLLENLTLRNRTPYKGSQAEALSLKGDRCVLHAVDFFSCQDTLQLTGRVYVADCIIAGDVDFVWGSGAALFERCEIRAVHDGYIVQSRNPEGKHGYAFVDCKLTAGPGVKKCWLARIDSGRFPGSEVTFVRCAMGTHIPPEGWLVTGENQGSIRFGEFATTDPAGGKLDVSRRIGGSKQFASKESEPFGDAAIFLGGEDGWNPKRALSGE